MSRHQRILPGNSGMSVFSVDGNVLKLRGIITQGGTLGGLAMMIDSLTLRREFIAPRQKMMDTAVTSGR